MLLNFGCKWVKLPAECLRMRIQWPLIYQEKMLTNIYNAVIKVILQVYKTLYFQFSHLPAEKKSLV